MREIARLRRAPSRPRRNPAKGLIYKLREPAASNRPWVSILPSGVFGVFATWDEAMEYQGAPMRSANHG